MLVYILLSIIIFYLIYQLFFQLWTPSPPKQLLESSFFYYGHRGAPAMSPENTLLSFNVAFKNNMDGIELDVQLTQDNQIVIYHDQYINYKNNVIDIRQLTLKQIKTINVNNDFKDQDKQFIPTLNEVLDMIPESIVLNIEIKSYGWNSRRTAEKQILELLLKYNINEQIIISSFNPFIIKRIKKLNPNISTAFIWTKKSYYAYKLFSYYSKPDAFHVNINDVNQKLVNWFAKKNINIYAYTVNSKENVEKAKKYNLNGIFTDNPKIKNV